MAVYVGHHGELALFPGVAATLEELKKRYLLGVISNAEGWYQHSKLDHLGIAEYFQVIVTSGEVGYSKPDSRIFEMALELASVKPHEALFVGDRLDIDVTGAVAAGMHAVWFNHWGGAQPDGTGQLTLEQVHDLVWIIDRITE